MKDKDKKFIGITIIALVIFNFGVFIGAFIIFTEYKQPVTIYESKEISEIYFNEYYYDPSCCLSYSMDLENSIIAVTIGNLTKGVYALVYGQIIIFEINQSYNETIWAFRLDIIKNVEFTEIYLFEFIQDNSEYLVIREIKIIDFIQICMQDDGCRWVD